MTTIDSNNSVAARAHTNLYVIISLPKLALDLTFLTDDYRITPFPPTHQWTLCTYYVITYLCIRQLKKQTCTISLITCQWVNSYRSSFKVVPLRSP
jgi:hypothetical protein